jgi:hypothetical protein
VKKKLSIALVLSGFIALSACSSAPPAYEGAFDASKAPGGAPIQLNAPVETAFKAVKWVLIKQGFQIQKIDPTSGTVTAERDYVDPDDKEKSYLIDVSVVVQDGVTKSTSMVALSATQATLLHTKEHTWWHLLWIFPIIPTGTVYQTVNTGEGTVMDKTFYTHFYQQVRESAKG